MPREGLLSHNTCIRLRKILPVRGDYQLGGKVKWVCTKLCTKSSPSAGIGSGHKIGHSAVRAFSHRSSLLQ
jgi:hypothetical protein